MLTVSKSLNGVIIFNESDSYVAKILDARLEPDFLDNTKRACQLIPEHTPAMIGSNHVGNYSCVFFEFVPQPKMKKFSDWQAMLVEVTPVIKKLYFRAGIIKKIKAKAYVRTISNKLDSSLIGKRFLAKELKKTANLFNKCLAQYPPAEINFYTLFCHGDLTPNNVVNDGRGNILILDWANGGIHNAFYDLMIEDVYAPNARVWQEFGSLDFVKNNDRDIFHGWSKTFCNMISKLTKKNITNDTIRLSLIIALAEMALKNFLRHQTPQEAKEGARVLTMINQVLEKIVA